MTAQPRRTIDPLAQLKPLSDVERAAEDQSLWIAHGDDPQLVWKPSPALRTLLRSIKGVTLEISFELLDGELADPCIYVDWGAGFSELSKARLRSSAPGVYRAFSVAQGAQCWQIRIDPSTGPCRFRVTALTVEPEGSLATPETAGGRAVAGVKTLLRPLRRVVNPIRHRLPLLGRSGAAASAGATADLSAYRHVWQHAFNVARNTRSPQFAGPALAPPPRDPDTAKTIAFYLPQFHPIPENDAWWGKGFTEWSNVGKATPQFVGHYQPRLPADLGYYDLRQPESLRAQVALAMNAGLDGFCFHYYWFAGKRILERPLDMFVTDPELEFPFCLCWANENWTRRWDGQEQDILIAQDHSPEDDIAVFDDMALYMRSPRYLKLNNRHLLIVYRPDVLPDPLATLQRWRARAAEIGLGELHILATTAFGFSSPTQHGFDGLIQFPPHGISAGEITREIRPLSPEYKGRIYDYPQVVDTMIDEIEACTDGSTHFGVMPGWDNEPRKPGAAHVFHNADPESFYRWLSAALKRSRHVQPAGARAVFINAWNEWAEGAYLEPDRWFGHGYLQALRSAIASEAPRLNADHPIIARSHLEFGKRHDCVVLLHIYYPELIEWFAERLSRIDSAADLVITFPDTWTEADLLRLANAFNAAYLMPTTNLGRDVGPFVLALQFALDQGYALFCKIHSKRSPHQTGGDAWRAALVDALIGPQAFEAAAGRFAGAPSLGLLATAASQTPLSNPDVVHNNLKQMERLARLLGFAVDLGQSFPAGTMFWGRAAAFRRLSHAGLANLAFDIEMGRIDGAVAHALERLMASIATASGFDARFEL